MAYSILYIMPYIIAYITGRAQAVRVHGVQEEDVAGGGDVRARSGLSGVNGGQYLRGEITQRTSTARDKSQENTPFGGYPLKLPLCSL